jgi:pyridoxamine 5'-phosphate oxidase
MVFVKQADERGFQFFTNYESPKGRELAEQPHAALCFFWGTLPRQVRVEGDVNRLSAEESDAYFATRPRGSQLGAWASDQSQPVPRRDALLDRFLELEVRYSGQPVPRPPHWGGYLLAPRGLEFWQGRENRFHERWLYTPDGAGGWHITLLQP